MTVMLRLRHTTCRPSPSPPRAHKSARKLIEGYVLLRPKLLNEVSHDLVEVSGFPEMAEKLPPPGLSCLSALTKALVLFFIRNE